MQRRQSERNVTMWLHAIAYAQMGLRCVPAVCVCVCVAAVCVCVCVCAVVCMCVAHEHYETTTALQMVHKHVEV